jgi:hypothetical protein
MEYLEVHGVDFGGRFEIECPVSTESSIVTVNFSGVVD